MSALASLLLRDGRVTDAVLRQALERLVLSGQRLDTVLLELDALRENEMAAYLAAAGGLEPALMGLGTAAAERVSWYPNFAPLHQRRQALEDFDRSRVAARVRTRVALARARVNLYNKQTDDEAGDTRVPRGVPEDAWPLARCDQRLTRRLRLL